MVYFILYYLLFTRPLTEMSNRNRKIIMFLGSRVRSVRTAILPPSVSPLPKQCGILNILQPFRPPRPVTGISLVYYIRQSC
jgi:hypothetical protein